MNKIVVRLVECTDHDVDYGFLVVESEEKLTVKDIQDKIDDIKGHFVVEEDLPEGEELGEDDILYDEFTVEDVINRLPKSWNVEYYSGLVVEI